MLAHPLTRNQVKAILKQTNNLRDQALLTLGLTRYQALLGNAGQLNSAWQSN